MSGIKSTAICFETIKIIKSEILKADVAIPERKFTVVYRF